MAKLPSDPGNIEPPLLTGGFTNNDELPNFTPTPAPINQVPHGAPSVAVDMQGYIERDAGMYGTHDLGRYNEPDIFSYRNTMDQWLDFNHPDDEHLFSLSDLHDSDVNTGNKPAKDTGDQFGPSDFMFTQFHPGFDSKNFDINRFVSQFSRFPAGPISPNAATEVDHGRVIIGGDESFGYNSPVDPDTGQPVPTGPVLNQAALDDPGAASVDTSTGAAANTATPRRTSNSPRIGMGTSTAMNARIGTSHNPIFGVGAQSGQHYFNDGTGWKPIGQAPADVRWAQNSGTGNFTADQTSRGLSGWNPADSVTNNTGDTGDPGLNIFRSGRWQLDPGGGFTQTGETSGLSGAPGQGSGAPILTPQSAQAYNEWLARRR